MATPLESFNSSKSFTAKTKEESAAYTILSTFIINNPKFGPVWEKLSDKDKNAYIKDLVDYFKENKVKGK